MSDKLNEGQITPCLMNGQVGGSLHNAGPAGKLGKEVLKPGMSFSDACESAKNQVTPPHIWRERIRAQAGRRDQHRVPLTHLITDEADKL